MIRNVSKILNDYYKAFEQINGVYEQAKKYADDNFVKTSPMYKSTMSKALDVRNEALKPIMATCKEEITKTLQGARKQVQDVVLAQPTPEQLKQIEFAKTGAFSDFEKSMMLDSVKNNYIASKMMHQVLGENFEPHSIENIMNHLNKIETECSHYWDYLGVPRPDSYEMKVIMREGGYTSDVSDTINEFVARYSSGDEK